MNGKSVPHSFDISSQNSTQPPRSIKLDVRIVDQDTIDMANKFYALTAPLIGSVLNNDLTAEFTFDLSQDEINVIKHFQTASLILGRSGTGKTTCLVFKLVGKHLARKKLDDEQRIKQVSYVTFSSTVDLSFH